jgi:hypothetical protein
VSSEEGAVGDGKGAIGTDTDKVEDGGKDRDSSLVSLVILMYNKIKNPLFA